MKRVVTVWWPDWPVVAAGASAGPAIVLRANRVVARSPSAAAEGVAIGQRRRIAQQRCPEAVILDHDPARDARAFEPVVRAVAAFTPRVEQVEPGWLSLDARGPSRYFGGDEAFAGRVAAAAVDAVGPMGGGTGVGVGIADGCFAAAVAARRAAGRGGRPVIVPAGATPGFLAPLPVAWLHELGEADPELVGLFARMGLARLGDVAGLDGGDVLARFGPPGRHAHHLAAGTDERAPGGTEPAPERRVERTFDDPVTNVAPLVFVAKQLADELVATLGAEGRVCTRLVVMAETEHGERSERVWYRAAGLSVPAMVERVRWQLDGWAAGIGEMDDGGGRPHHGRHRGVATRAGGGARRRRRPARAVGRPVRRRRAGGAGRHPARRAGRGRGRARAGLAGRPPAGGPLRLGPGLDDRPRRSRRHRRAGAAAPRRAVAGRFAGAVAGGRAAGGPPRRARRRDRGAGAGERAGGARARRRRRWRSRAARRWR